MKLSILSACVCTTILAAGTLPASAATGDWAHRSTAAGTDTLFTQTGETAIKLACSPSLGVQATIYLKGVEVSDDRLKYLPKRRIKIRDGVVNTESTTEKSGAWAYIKATDMLVSSEPWQGRRIYNAVVKGESVDIDVDKVGEVSLTMPAINDDFKTFARSCDATS